MSFLIPPLPRVPLSGARPMASRPNPLAELWRDIVGSWQRARLQARQPGLDDATLRDLGISRSELGSFEAEASGRAPATRLRTLMSGSHGGWRRQGDGGTPGA